MNMNIRPIKRAAALAVFLLFVCVSAVNGQGGNAYRTLNTAVGLSVRDTLAGQNLQVNFIKSKPKHGELSANILSIGTSNTPSVYELVYQPDAGFTGVDTFVVELNYGVSYPHLVYRAYRAAVYSSILEAKPDYATTEVNTNTTVDVLSNDRGTRGPFIISALPSINNGFAAVTADNKIVFAPAPDFTGVAYVSYTVCDALNVCKTSLLSIGVNDGTAHRSDTLHTATVKNRALFMPLTDNGYTLFQAPASGIVSLTGGNMFRYTPNPAFTGKDRFVLVNNTYTPAVFKTVLLSVLDAPAANTMAIDDEVFTPEGKPVTFNVRNNDIGELPVRSWLAPPGLPGTLSATSPSGQVTFTPEPGFAGVATFQYRLGNDFTDLEIGTVRVVVENLAPAAATYQLHTPVNTPLVVNYEVPFNAFNFVIKNQPTRGSLRYTPGFSTQQVGGTAVSGYNLLIYTPNSGYIGNDVFTIDYCIQSNGNCKSVQIKVSVAQPVQVPGPYCVNDCVWTGDANNDGIVNNKDLLPLGYYLGYNGPTRRNAVLEWAGQRGSDWKNPYAASPIDLKHADADGNGVLTSEDTLAISTFYGQTHNLPPNIPPTSKGLPFTFKFSPANPRIGDLVEIDIDLGTADNPVSDVYGFTLDLALSHTIVASPIQFEYLQQSWLNQNAPYLTLIKNPVQGRVESAFTRTGGVAISGRGRVGKARYIVIDVIDGARQGDYAIATLTAHNSATIDGAGRTTIGEETTIEIPVRLTRDPNRPTTGADLKVYPSPASDYVQFHLNGNEQIEQLTITDMQGRMVYDSGAVQWKRSDLSVAGWQQGHYVAVARTASGRIAKMFTVDGGR
jgi:Secretion system C-terminal sorting domain/Bacterial Ig domain